MKLLLIADDLTGALDSAAAFAQRGLSVVCALGLEGLPLALSQAFDVVCVSTNSREANEKNSSSILISVLEIAAKFPDWDGAIVFKKIDSRLKGHVASEIKLLRVARPSILCCPAIPRLGRFVKNGQVTGAGIATGLPVVEIAKIRDSEVIDATTDADLDAAIAGVDLATMFVGAAGLAEALARRICPIVQNVEPIVLRAPALFAIGSRDPVTMSQLAGFTSLQAPNGAIPVNAPASHRVQVVQMTQGRERISSVEASERFSDAISKWITAHRPETLLACGGESAAGIAQNLGCLLFQVRGEILPGLPVSTMLDSKSEMQIITKSGGFGAQDTLAKIAGKLVN